MRIKLAVISLSCLWAILTFAIFAIITKTVEPEITVYKIVCMENHQYLKYSDGINGFMSINLTDDGRPISCTADDETIRPFIIGKYDQ